MTKREPSPHQEDCAGRPFDGERWRSPVCNVWTWGNGGRWCDDGGFVANDLRTVGQLIENGWRRLRRRVG